MNKVTVFGRLGSDPEVRTTNNDGKVANISVASEERWTSKDGEKKRRTEWHRVTLYGGVAGVVEKYLKKGDPVLLMGKMRTRKWQDSEGRDRYSTEIVVDFDGELHLVPRASVIEDPVPEGDSSDDEMAAGARATEDA